jgi:hypothetical protein
VESNPVAVVGIYKANGGLLGELSYILGHAVGIRHCELCDITHSPLWKKREFRNFEQRMQQEFGLGVRLLHMNERGPKESAASEGREPCVLLEYSDGSFSMLLDYVELKAVKGKVASFEKLIRSRLDFFI